MGAIPFNSTQSNSVQSDPARHAGAEAHQFVVNLAWPFILLSCPQNRGVGMCRGPHSWNNSPPNILGLDLGRGG